MMRVSQFERQHAAPPRHTDALAGSTRLSALGTSLMQDLLRFRPEPGEGLVLLEVLAAALRHSRALRLHLQIADRVMPLTIRPAEREVGLALPLDRFLALDLTELRVRRVELEPARESTSARPGSGAAGDGDAAASSPVQAPGCIAALSGLLWALALRGSRAALLPEIAGLAAYRVAPAADLRQIALGEPLAGAIERLRSEAAPLREIAHWPGMSPDLSARMLNGLYLLASLIVSRAHPSTIRAG